MFIFTCSSPAEDVTKSYPDGSLVICRDIGFNMFCPVRVDAVEVGHYICQDSDKPGASLEVTQVQEI